MVLAENGVVHGCLAFVEVLQVQRGRWECALDDAGFDARGLDDCVCPAEGGAEKGDVCFVTAVVGLDDGWFGGI